MRLNQTLKIIHVPCNSTWQTFKSINSKPNKLTHIVTILTPLFASINPSTCILNLACEQALWGALAAGQEKEGELAATSLEFAYLHR